MPHTTRSLSYLTRFITSSHSTPAAVRRRIGIVLNLHLWDEFLDYLDLLKRELPRIVSMRDLEGFLA
jgi:hypothetical protein